MSLEKVFLTCFEAFFTKFAWLEPLRWRLHGAEYARASEEPAVNLP